MEHIALLGGILLQRMLRVPMEHILFRLRSQIIREKRQLLRRGRRSKCKSSGLFLLRCFFHMFIF